VDNHDKKGRLSGRVRGHERIELGCGDDDEGVLFSVVKGRCINTLTDIVQNEDSMQLSPYKTDCASKNQIDHIWQIIQFLKCEVERQ
jgi:hypothetical protein